MICDHSIMTDIVLNNKYILIHCGGQFMTADFTTNRVTSRHTVEIFDTVQELVDHGLALGLACSPWHLIAAMEHGATIPPAIVRWLGTQDLDWGLSERLGALEL